MYKQSCQARFGARIVLYNLVILHAADGVRFLHPPSGQAGITFGIHPDSVRQLISYTTISLVCYFSVRPKPGRISGITTHTADPAADVSKGVFSISIPRTRRARGEAIVIRSIPLRRSEDAAITKRVGYQRFIFPIPGQVPTGRANFQCGEPSIETAIFLAILQRIVITETARNC